MRLHSEIIGLRALSAGVAALVFAAVAAGSIGAFGSFGCNEVHVFGPLDAGDPCQAAILEYGCKVQAAGTPGCGPDLQSGTSLGHEIVLDAGSLSPGCNVQVNYVTPDQENQCNSIGTCICSQDDGGGAFSWACYQ